MAKAEGGEIDELVTAVVLADAFELGQSFGPLLRTQDSVHGIPWSLLPFLGEPLLSWTLEALCSSGVQRAYIFAGDCLSEIKEWFRTTSFADDKSIEVHFRASGAHSVGDFLREADSLHLKGDFLLVRVGYIGNLNLNDYLSAFREKRQKDPNLVMECLVSSSPISTSSSRSSVHVSSPSGRLLHYETNPLFPRSKRTHIPLHILESNREVLVRSDLEEIGVEICSADVPPLFSENFDYQVIRPDFIHGILTSDILDKVIYCTIIEEASKTQALSTRSKLSWGALVRSTWTYEVATKAVLSRWTYPVVPDVNVPGSIERYETRRSRLYLGRSVQLSRSSKLNQLTLIGHTSSVGPTTSIAGSVVGNNCRIGSSCTIIDSHIMHDAVISDACVILRSIVGPGAVIGKKCRLEQGTVVGQKVGIKDNSFFREARISRDKWNEEGKAEGNRQQADVSDHSVQSASYLWPSEEKVMEAELELDEDESGDEKFDVRNIKVNQLGAQLERLDLDAISDVASISSVSIISSSSEEEYLDESSDGDDEGDVPGMMDSADAIDSLARSTSFASFENEAIASFDRAMKEEHTIENAALELKTLRMASNVSLQDVRVVVVGRLSKNVLDKIEKIPGEKNARELYGATKQVVERWGPLLPTLGASLEDMVLTVVILQQYLAQVLADTKNNESARKIFPLFLRAFYDEDIATEEAIVEWWKSPQSRSSTDKVQEMVGLREAGSAFVKALVEAESESDDDGDEVDDEDEDEGSE